MKKNSNHITIQKHLTQAELLDYTNGVLGNGEMYRLELHLNECELCSDALDGISSISNPKEILESINDKIQPSKKKVYAPNYMAIAASVSLVAVLGLSYWLITKPTQIDTVAINSTTEIAEEKDTPASKIKPAPEEKEEDPVDELITLTAPQVVEDELGNTNIAAQTQVDLDSQSSTKQKSVVPQEKIELAEPLVAITDVSGEMAKEDDVNQLEEIINEPLNEGNNNYIDAQPARTASRVAKKSSSSTSVRLKDQKEPEPVGGMATLKSHIIKNLKYPQDAIDNNVNGTVVLDIHINSDGSISNISVTKGLGSGCDVEAIKLISTGPKWTPKVINGSPIKSSRQVKIKFKQ